MTPEDWRHSWIARHFVCSLPSPWSWVKAHGIEDMGDDEKWAEYGRKLSDGKVRLPSMFPEHYAKSVAYVERWAA